MKTPKTSIKKQLLFSFLAVILAATSLAAAPPPEVRDTGRSFLWETKTGENTLYLLGSMHILKQDAYPLPEEMEKAYENSSIVVFETDLGDMDRPAVQEKMIKLGMYAAGDSLSNNISKQTYSDFSKKLAEMGLPAAQFELMKPWMCGLTLSLMELTRLGFNPELGLDQHFYKRARSDGKKIMALESIDFQLDTLGGLDELQQENFLKQTLKDLEVVGQMSTDMEKAWKTGDIEKLSSIMEMSFKDYPDIYERLVLDRNRTWARQIGGLMARGNVLVVVGAAHLVGRESVIELLRQKGHNVVRR